MKVLNKKFAVMRLGAYLILIRACFLRAWDEYQSLPIEQRIKLTARSRANVIHDLIVYAVRQAFDSVADIRLMEINKLFLMAVGCDLVLRFKKLDESLRSSGIPTQQSIEFSSQGDLPGIEKVTHLEAGYCLNDLETAIEGIYICCPNGTSVLWYYEIEPEEGEGSNIILLPRPAAPMPGARFTIKNDEQGKEEAGDDGDS